MKRNLIYILLICFPTCLLSQSNGDDWNDRDIQSYESAIEVARISIDFLPGYETEINLERKDLFAYIDPNLPLDGGEPNEEGIFALNYIREYTPKANNITSEIPEHEGLDYTLWNESITYFDDLAREIQKVDVKASGYGNDLIQSIIYEDITGRKKQEYLPYAIAQGGVNGPGGYRPDPTSELQEFYSNYYGDEDGNYAFADKKYDGSPLNRVLKQSSPGYSWKLDGENIVEIKYGSNSDGEVIKFNIDNNVLMKDGYYSENTLFSNTVIDEEGNKTVEFKNKQGQLILQAKGNSLTYYVYDAYGLLKYVIPPVATNLISDIDNYSGSLDNDSNDIIKNYCYYYEYDEDYRMTHKKLPGNDIVFMVYNNKDNVILVQDGELRKTKKWIFTKYDAFDRIIMTGTHYFNTSSQESMQGYVNQTNSKDFEVYSGIATNYGYTTDTYPGIDDQDEVLIVNYYGSYDARSLLHNPDDYEFLEHEIGFTYQQSDQVWELPTISRVKILNPTEDISFDWLESITYYDKYENVIQTISNNHLGGLDIVSNKVNFTGEILETIIKHDIGGDVMTIQREFVYDNISRRLLQTKHKINSQIQTTISSTTYTELGAVANESIHVVGNTPLQKLDYCYNIKGWITDVNKISNLQNDYFALKLEYNTAGRYAAHNGNIGAIHWNSKHFGEAKKYGFDYDDNNRLVEANDIYNSFYTTKYGYDDNGNFKLIQRNASVNETGVLIDDLTFTYNGNQLKNVNDNDDNPNYAMGFTDNDSFVSEEYTYDKNGNLTKDFNKNIQVSYNLLNLPQTVDFILLTHNSLDYIYSATGEKLRKITHIDENNATKIDYIRGFVYEEDELQFILTENGRLVDNGKGGYNYEYFIKDHLGNIRIRFDQNGEILQDMSYYPFGMPIESGLTYENTTYSPESNYLYGGKELQKDYDLSWYDYEARFYDPVLGSFVSLDPKSEKRDWLSAYNFVQNNPINRIDPTGTLDDEWIRTGYADGREETFEWLSGYGGNDFQIVHNFWETESGDVWNLGYEKWHNWPNTEAAIADLRSGGELALGYWNPGWWENASGSVDYPLIDPIDIITGSIAAKFTFPAAKGMTNTQLVQRAATFADDFVPFTKNAGVTGTLKHQAANRYLHLYQLRNGSRGLQTNFYFNNGVGNRGFLDVVNHSSKTVWDFKFGNATWGPGQLLKYQRNFPGYNISIMRP